MRSRIACLPLLLLPLSGCAVAALTTVGAVSYTAAQDRTMGEALDDTSASSEIKFRLISESYARFEGVDVDVSSGLALLTGRVDSPEDRTFAEGVAWSSTRVTDVANEIRIEPPGGFMARASDRLISSRVRARLLGSRTTKSINFNIETYDGVVYLMGIARTQEELRKAAEEASRVGGVRQVISYVRIRDMPGRVPVQPLEAQPPYQPRPDGTYEDEPLPELRGVNYREGWL